MEKKLEDDLFPGLGKTKVLEMGNLLDELLGL